MNPNMLK